MDSSSTQNSNNSVVVALAALAIVTDPFAVGNVPELAVVVIFALALCSFFLIIHQLMEDFTVENKKIDPGCHNI